MALTYALSFTCCLASPAAFLCFLIFFLFMIQSKIKPIKPFIYMKSGHLFRRGMWSGEKDAQTAPVSPDCAGNGFLGTRLLPGARELRIQNEILPLTLCVCVTPHSLTPALLASAKRGAGRFAAGAWRLPISLSPAADLTWQTECCAPCPETGLRYPEADSEDLPMVSSQR